MPTQEEEAKLMGPKRLRESILGEVGDAAQRSPLPTYIPNNLKPLAESICIGSFYEIDGSKLPPRSPTQLQSIRAVMVTAKTELNVTIRYPSSQSLESYFCNLESALRSKLYPALDEKFVMGPQLAIEVLGRQILSEEFAQLRHTQSFWVADSYRVGDQSPSPVSVCDAGATSDSKVDKAGPCYTKLLQSSRIKGWGSQRVVAYVRESKQIDGCEEAVSLVRVKEEEKENRETECKQIAQYVRKRKPGRPAGAVIKKAKHSRKPKPVKPKAETHENKGATYIERWPVNRYEAAAQKLAEVLKANGAVYGNAISRFQLRGEARSQIGDTGLLDHLLKHLAGKVVPGGNERLRRRCDAAGKMEYWLESADLAEVRKQAGVQDPYWTPPPGWKPGDCLTAHDCLCCQQVRQLKEELNGMRSQMAELQSKNEEEQAIIVTEPECTTVSGGLNSSNPKEMYDSLLKKKSILEEQLLEVSKTLMELEEDMKLISHKAAAEQKLLMLTNSTKSSPGDEVKAINSTSMEQDSDEDKDEESESNGSDDEGDERESKADGPTLMKMKLKLKPCGQQDNVNSNSHVSSQQAENRAEDLMALTPASTSPHSTTTC